MFPAFLALASRRVVVVGGGPVAAGKHEALLAAGAAVTVGAPDIDARIERARVTIVRRRFEPADLDGAWWVVAAAPPDVNRRVLEAANERRIFVNAVDDPAHATAYLGGVVRRDGVTIAISTGGRAPAMAGLLREALDAWLPGELDLWMRAADEARRQWKDQRVPMEQRRPQLLQVLNELYSAGPLASDPAARGTRPTYAVRRPGPMASVTGYVGRVPPSQNVVRRPGPMAPAAEDMAPATRRNGTVSLVGAGPGDPDLWTVRAVRLVEDADLVLYDSLVDVEALRRMTKAQCFSVGKRARRDKKERRGGVPVDSLSQETIHKLMIRAAKQGKRVVRLKGGDPFVFGRGGEEALALAMAGVPFEVVPGVTTAVAAPELAGIPVTHRGIASGFLVMAGHTSETVDNTLNAVRPNSISIVILMGVGARADLAERLMAHGWAPETPAAIVCGASTPDAWIWTGRLDAMGKAEAPAGAAGVLVVGEVVKVRERLGMTERVDEVKYGGH
jgi:uroporphyrin-III C-methyltransferase/precorrin-2 dehydrogenase/sirohydrochlorin ferrochelatase